MLQHRFLSDDQKIEMLHTDCKNLPEQNTIRPPVEINQINVIRFPVIGYCLKGIFHLEPHYLWSRDTIEREEAQT